MNARSYPKQLSCSSALSFAGAVRQPLLFRVACSHALLLPSRRPSSFLGRHLSGAPLSRSPQYMRRSVFSASSAPPLGSFASPDMATAPKFSTTGQGLARLSALAGTPDVVPALRDMFASRAAAQQLDPEFKCEAVTASFPYALDDFQLDAMRALCGSKNVILSSPTGSGCV
jgi:hypothetical protein